MKRHSQAKGELSGCVVPNVAPFVFAARHGPSHVGCDVEDVFCELVTCLSPSMP